MINKKHQFILYSKESDIKYISDYSIGCLSDIAFNIHKLERKYFHLVRVLHLKDSNNLMLFTEIKNKKLKLLPRSKSIEISYKELDIIQRKEKIEKIENASQASYNRRTNRYY